jgi:hypothetical protein
MFVASEACQQVAQRPDPPVLCTIWPHLVHGRATQVGKTDTGGAAQVHSGVEQPPMGELNDKVQMSHATQFGIGDQALVCSSIVEVALVMYL